MRTLVIIPSFNESENLPSLISDLNKFGYDYLIINDKSTDDTVELADDNGYSILNLVLNVGIAGVTRIGFKYAYEHDYDCVVSIDGDGQHPPEYIHSLIKAIEEGNDYAVGSRFINKKKPFTLRMLGSRIISFLIKLKTGVTVSDPTSGMRAVGKKVIKVFAKNMNFCAEPDTLCYLLRKKYKVKEVDVQMKDRVNGESYFISPFKSIKYMVEMIISIIFFEV